MQSFLRSLRFSIDNTFAELMGLMQAAQQSRMQTRKSVTDKVTRSTALAVILSRSAQIRNSLQSFDLKNDEYLRSIGLELPIKAEPAEEIDIHASMEEALRRYAKSNGAILKASDDVLAIAILEDVVANIEGHFDKYELEGRLLKFGLDIKRL